MTKTPFTDLHCASVLRTIFAPLARPHERQHVHSVRDFPQAKLDSEINARFLTLHCSKCPRLSAYQDFFKFCVNNLCFQLPQNVTRTDEMTRVIRHKRYEIGPSYLLSEHGVWLAKWCKIHKVYIHSHSVLLFLFTNIFIHIQQLNLYSRNISIHI